eukprot:CAMPEP_0114631674 /NCGR_PEP_ID=MMETSP0168-20121206/14538_1 /TAXON_ID=95228 ORGANISM="Vannella sp., Strain DIVA3 517/6/12" /NCGR_SAMPLE_ID=MMETSP0168 /ASSEMBLY_ACC=CAM_ASM_000044 /LENGTH=77 /DNA_ID=CAMNT_0001843255 /DNA_START=235 /DNA_END=465 /DNA_ORIENTATION=-
MTVLATSSTLLVDLSSFTLATSWPAKQELSELACYVGSTAVVMEGSTWSMRDMTTGDVDGRLPFHTTGPHSCAAFES